MSITVILPKHPSITSAYVADTMESDEDLNEYSQTCEQSLTSKGKDSRSQTWLRRLKKMKWMQLLFSRTLKPSHTTSFVDAWTSYLRDSHANPFPAAVNDNQPKTQDTCTRGLQMELPLVDRESSSSKTSKESSQPRQETENPYLNMSSETWKKEVTERRGAWLARMKSLRPINVNESSSWPTPQASEEKANRHRNNPNAKGSQVWLTTEVLNNWATPQASDHVEGARTRTDSNQKCLGRDLNRMYSPPVPTNDNTSGKNRELLSPNWVEQLMGVPVGLTQLPTGLID